MLSLLRLRTLVTQTIGVNEAEFCYILGCDLSYEIFYELVTTIEQSD